MLGKLHEKYLEVSRKKLDYTGVPAPYGYCFGVPIASAEDKLILDHEAILHTAEDLGYE